MITTFANRIRPVAFVRCFATGGSKHRFDAARIIPATSSKVWSEMRDFVGQMKHFGLAEKTTHFNPKEAASDATGCIRKVLTPNGKDHLFEVCTAHSDDEKSFSLTVESPNPFGLDDYDGKVTVAGLLDGSTLVRIEGSYSGPEALKAVIGGAYTSFFTSIDDTLAGGTAVEIGSGGQASVGAGRVANKVAIVTGGAKGLGEAISRSLAAEGATVIVADTNGEDAKKVSSEIPGGFYACLDVTKNKEVESLMEATAKKFGRVDVVINNAGIAGQQVPTHEHPINNWLAVTDVNLNGAFYVLRAALAQMSSQSPSGGVVLNMSSTVGMQAFGNIPAYTASKGALISLTRSTAVEYSAKGIRVVALAPTVVKTPLVEGFMESASPEVSKAMNSLNPVPGMPVPADVAKVVVFVCSDDAKWISGSTLPVDGAYCAGNVAPHGRG